MDTKIPWKGAAALAAALALGSPAWSHGDAAAHGAARPAVKEQQPWGIAGDAKGARTIAIAMGDDMRFRPDRIEVKQGETVRFVVRNGGKLLHEMVIGTPEALRQHAALMKKFSGMEHDEPFMAHVGAGQRGELVWNFNRAGRFQFACLVPGHFEAGMIGTIVVTPREGQ
jgi:uncharacterized cupredoxin-like copper-binding protein